MDNETIGFGVPKTKSPCHFKVIIPRGKDDGDIIITEVLGLGVNGMVEDGYRLKVPAEYWKVISRPLMLVFNEQLKKRKLKTGRWKPGVNQVDRLLGKELCVLGWAVVGVGMRQINTVINKWNALTMEDRWWFYNKGVRDKQWRDALSYGLGGKR